MEFGVELWLDKIFFQVHINGIRFVVYTFKKLGKMMLVIFLPKEI